MNNIEIEKTVYLRSSRTLETILVSNKKISNLFYIYNFEGISFRVFSNYQKLISFFQEKAESDYYFENEADLDDFLLRLKLVV